MSDLIDRQMAIDAIEKHIDTFDAIDTNYLDGLRTAMSLLHELPSAQPEIIRCKDCKHRYIDGENVQFNVCELNHIKVQSNDWFCADAERRTDE